MKKYFILVLLFIAFHSNTSAYAYNPEGFKKFVNYIQAMARQEGVSEATLHKAFANVKFSYKAVEQDIKQPERKKGPEWQAYKNRVITDGRIKRAKKMLQDNYVLLDAIEKKFRVEKEIIVALWAVESNFGEYMGDFNIINALTSLAYEGRRREFFQNELIKALKIIDEGHFTAESLKGSWAGAFGQCQFMPSTFMSHAIDHDGDGKKDIRFNKGDSLASAANYLHNIGWQYGAGWAKRVKLPMSFRSSYVGKEITKPVYKWKQMGVRYLDGNSLHNSVLSASIIDPDGQYGNRREVYIVYDNYKRIMEWNRSTYFATSIGLIADAIKN